MAKSTSGPDKLVELFDHMLPSWDDSQAMPRVLERPSNIVTLGKAKA
jgi:hypothetical protein